MNDIIYQRSDHIIKKLLNTYNLMSDFNGKIENPYI